MGNYQCFSFGKILHTSEKKYLGKYNKGLLGNLIKENYYILRKKIRSR